MKKKYLTSEEMFKIDQLTIEEIGIPSLVLMERAAYSVFLSLNETLGTEDVILIIAGPGNNGADAVALARMLYLANYSVQLHVINSENYSDGMAQQMNIAKNIDLPIIYETAQIDFDKATYIIDGIFGIGVSREITGSYQEMIEEINRQKQSRIIALDIPSGLSAKTGRAFNTVVQADDTYTFGFLKNGMDTEQGQNLCGNIIVCDIGYPIEILENKL